MTVAKVDKSRQVTAKSKAKKKATAKKSVSGRKKSASSKSGTSRSRTASKSSQNGRKRTPVRKTTSAAGKKKKSRTVSRTASQASKKSPSQNHRSKGPARKAHLTPAEIRRYRSLLLLKRGELTGDLTAMEDEALHKELDQASGMAHMADAGSDYYEQEFTLGLIQSERAVVREIDEALERMNDGVYGICLGTGKPISKGRLDVQPWAKYSVNYARLIEQGLARPHNGPIGVVDISDE
jgi:RNA polymerase-binding transcription factor DksA